MNKNLTKVFSLLIAALFTIVFTACGKDPVVEDSASSPSGQTQTQASGTNDNSSATGTQNTSSDSTFTYAIAGDPNETVNVITTSDRYGLSTIKMIYSPLYMNNADGINYFLATGYSVSDDYTTFTFQLREDVTWSDGEPFNADDVVFTYTEMAKEENLGWAYSQLVYPEGAVEIKKLDEYTVSFTFPFATPTALEMLSQIFIMPEHIYQEVEDYEHNDYNVNSVGTGPYKLVEYQAGSYLKFEANETYFKGTPHIPNIVFRIIENSDTALLALQSGEIDAYQTTPAEIKKLDLEASHLKTYSYSEGRIGYLMMNCNRITEEKVRQAILYALDRTSMNHASFLSEEYYLTPYSFLPLNSPFYRDTVEKYEQNIEKSKALLAEAAIPQRKLTLGYIGTDPVQSIQALLIQEQLAEVGLSVELASSDATALAAQMKNPANDYDMYLGGYIMGIDPDTFASLFESGAAYNYMYYTGYSTINELFAKGRSELDMEKRKEIYAQLQSEIQNTGAFYPIVSNNKILVISEKIQGIEEAGLVPVYTFEDTYYLKMAE